MENDGATCGAPGWDKTQESCTAQLALEKAGIKLACETTLHCKAGQNKKVLALQAVVQLLTLGLI